MFAHPAAGQGRKVDRAPPFFRSGPFLARGRLQLHRLSALPGTRSARALAVPTGQGPEEGAQGGKELEPFVDALFLFPGDLLVEF